jgi:hypothetical protein
MSHAPLTSTRSQVPTQRRGDPDDRYSVMSIETTELREETLDRVTRSRWTENPVVALKRPTMYRLGGYSRRILGLHSPAAAA